ncbi:MAG: hypothetical protein QOH06_193 [Acidobacteriota bacterium]|jgi:hypothetical protein|nr:hypothetical protein [Acidobacteriota bacterium]
MKELDAKKVQPQDDEMRDEYDFTGGVRGKHYKAMQEGYTITIHKADGTTVVKDVQPEGAVVLEPDVREYFPDSESVNNTLRSLITLIPMRKTAAKKRPQKSSRGRQQS